MLGRDTVGPVALIETFARFQLAATIDSSVHLADGWPAGWLAGWLLLAGMED